ncbi:MAG TPA: NusA-like transcription termination signal-binding factor [Thermoplasmatales archaeon]|nr:NusA-like transcription termination signal-binding factor [Thermoplasmatales archaeon]HEC82485.1 NusA-like transcription termination signal-binding factor [Thermoplasmatales archaeon]
MKIKLTQQEMHYISLAEVIIGLPILDCIERDNRITFIVGKGKLGKAIGKEARNIKKLENIFRKEVKFVEYDDDKKQFIINLFKPFKLEKIVVNEENNKVSVVVDSRDKGKAIGKDGRNINILREIAKRQHDIDEIKVL